jgi:hypothetical protein
MNEIVVLAGAEEDIFLQYCEQEEHHPERSTHLNADITHMYGLIAQNPFMGSHYHDRMRKVILKNWNLGIYYTVEGGRNMIMAVQNLQQSPKKIRAILKSRMPR